MMKHLVSYFYLPTSYFYCGFLLCIKYNIKWMEYRGCKINVYNILFTTNGYGVVRSWETRQSLALFVFLHGIIIVFLYTIGLKKYIYRQPFKLRNRL